MSQATLAGPAFGGAPAWPTTLLRAGRLLTEATIAAFQAALFAGLLWLILAGPGFLHDLASTTPLR